MDIKVDQINISGRIDALLGHLPSELMKCSVMDKIVNSPIMSGDKVVGVITDYDIDAGFWYGIIWTDTNPLVKDNYICSVELK